MARAPYGKGDLGAARAFLNNLGLLGNKRSEGVILRAANRAERQLASGNRPSNQDLRGHGRTPEHPGRRAPAHPAPAPVERSPRRHEAKHTGIGNLNRRPPGTAHQVTRLSNGDRYVQGTNKAVARFAAGVADGMGTNVKITYIGKDGKTHTLGQKGGIRPETLKKYMRPGRSIGEAIAEMIEHFYPKGGGGSGYGGGTVQFFMSSR